MNPLIDSSRKAMARLRALLTVVTDDPEIWQNAQQTAFCLVGRVLASDGVIRDEELHFIQEITPGEESFKQAAYVNYWAGKWDFMFDEPPAFLRAAIKADLEETTSSVGMAIINSLEEIALLAAASDDGVSPVELASIDEYCAFLRQCLVNEGITGRVATKAAESGVVKSTPSHAAVSPKSSSEDGANGGTSVENLLSRLDSMIGLNSVKREVRTLVNLARIHRLRQRHGFAVPTMSLHLVFSGNPGTGKTTVARLLAEVYREIGVLEKGHLVETDRSGLVGAWLGQTAIKVDEVVEKSLGGILFIDEAYSLTSDPTGRDTFGKEAVDTLLKRMEDKRDKLVVIVAGYTGPMKSFLASNPGLESRFNKFVDFPDYRPQELYDIFVHLCTKAEFTYDGAAGVRVAEVLKRLYSERKDNFANGRTVRNLFERCMSQHANRLAKSKRPTTEEITTLTEDDIPVE